MAKPYSDAQLDDIRIRMPEQYDQWLATVDQLRAEREEARDYARKLHQEGAITCVYCGHVYPPGSPTHSAEVLTAHIQVCEKHPMTLLKARQATAIEQLHSLANEMVHHSHFCDKPIFLMMR